VARRSSGGLGGRFQASPLGLRIFAATALVLVLALGGALLLISRRAGQAADQAIERGLAATQAAIEEALAARSERLLRSAQLLAGVPTYISHAEQALLAGSRSDLLDRAREFQDQARATWAMIVDAEGMQQAWTRAPNESDVPRGEGALVGQALGGEPAAGMWIEATPQGDSLYQAVAVPLIGQGGVLGALVLAEVVDSAFAARLKKQTASEVVFFGLDTALVPRVAVSTLPRGALDPALAGREAVSLFEADTAPGHLRVAAAGQTWIGALGPLRTAAGTRVGEYAGLRSREAELAPFERLRQSILTAFVGSLVLASLATVLVTRHITRPLRRLVQATRDVAEGRYSGAIAVDSRDEIGELAAAFDAMLAELREKRRLVEFLGGASQAVTAVVEPGAPTLRSARLVPGQLLAGRYELKQVLGAGGMGVVYRAWDRELEEAVAIKTLHPELVGDPALLERFKQEIRLARRISHPNVVRTHDLGEADGTYFITMEYVEGTTLDQVIGRRGALPTEVVLTIGKQLCRALEVAHGQGIVHRDVKPQNLVVDAQGFLKVMDFGIARLIEARQAGRTRTGLTAEGSIIGTPAYMAPEQLLGEPLDGRTDLYAAGAVLFECVTGRQVFEGTSFASLLMKQVQDPVPDPRSFNPSLPEPLAGLILKALAKDRERRWQTALEMLQALEEIKG
jgi:serine/threonine-protein kinase